MLRILALINGGRNRTIRGGDYHVIRVLKNWNKEHRISIILPKIGLESAKAISPNWYSIYLSSKGCNDVYSLPNLLCAYVIRIARSLFLVKNEEQDVIISSSHLLYDILPAILLSRKLNSKLVVYAFHIFRCFRTYKEGTWSIISLLSEKASLFLCKKADLIFVDNQEIKETLIRKGFETNRIYMTANGVETESIDSVKINLKKFDGCFCGSLDKRKGIYDLLHVWEKILTTFPKSKLVIIGQGPEYTNLSKKIKEKRLDGNICLTGYLSEEQKFSTIKSSRLFIFPSFEEGWGIAVSEAMACGLPVVCYNLEAYKVFGDNIIKVHLGDRETMAKTVCEILLDDNKREHLGLKAKEAARKFNWDTIASDEVKEIKRTCNNLGVRS